MDVVKMLWKTEYRCGYGIGATTAQWFAECDQECIKTEGGANERRAD